MGTTTKSLMPTLRFSEFKELWEAQKVSQITSRLVNPVAIDLDEEYREVGIRSHGKGLFHKQKTTGSSLGNKRVFWVKPNCFIVNIVFAWEQAIAKTTEAELGFIASHRFPMYEPLIDKANVDFLVYFFQRKKGKNILELASPGGAGRNKTLGQKEFEKTKLIVPKLAEQQKIAQFLSSADNKIQQFKRKHALMRQYKKGLMQQLFSQQVRFKDIEGRNYPDWKEKRFGDLFERVTRKNKKNCKNVMTISAQQGLINQQEYFNKSVSAADVTGYYLMNKGEFAYNKSYSKGYPLGAIKKLNRYDEGAVSTLYICFKAKENIVPEFYEQYFEGGLLNREIQKIAQEGARNHGLLNVSVVEFFRDIVIRLPSIEEQQKIADFLESIDKKTEKLSTQISQAETFKKGLLQQMFV